MTTLDTAPVTPAARLRGWDSIEFYVGNDRATAGFLADAFGFRLTDYAGPETGRDDIASYLLEQGDVRFVVTAGLDPSSPIWSHVREHGDGAQDLAFVVDDAAATYEAAIARGATSAREPYELHDEHGTLRLAAINTYGETKHTFVDRSDYAGYYCPGYVTTGLPPELAGTPVGLQQIDHVVGTVAEGDLDRWVAFYEDVMGFRQLRHFDEHQLATQYSALRSTVVTTDAGVTMPLNEPADGLKRSQIQEYLATYRGPGVQHIALATNDIVQAIAGLRGRGVRFLEANEEYFRDVRERLSFLDLPWDALQQLGILVDNEPDGHLLQLFTAPLTDRPTVFIEIIRGDRTRAGAARQSVTLGPSAMSTSWVPVPDGSPFPLHHLPFGVGALADGRTAALIAIGDHALDVDAARDHFDGTPAADGLLDADGTLNAFAAQGRSAHRAVRNRAHQLLSDPSSADALRPCLVSRNDVDMQLPVAVGDYVDFYSSLHHATNLGRILRPDAEALLPNWRHLPIGYHGRSGTIVADGTAIARPSGLRRTFGTDAEAPPTDGPSEMLDIELEVGFVCGAASTPGDRVTPADAESHLFGVCLVNDWSARDIQSYEYQPLGPFLGKSFATSIATWITPLDALDPFRVDPPAPQPAVSAHLRADRVRPAPRGAPPVRGDAATRHGSHAGERHRVCGHVLERSAADRAPHVQRRTSPPRRSVCLGHRVGPDAGLRGQPDRSHLARRATTRASRRHHTGIPRRRRHRHLDRLGWP